MKLGQQPRKWLEKKAKRGFRGYPIGTIAFYGPDERCATKVAVSVVRAPQSAPAELHRWFSEAGDLRMDGTILASDRLPREAKFRVGKAPQGGQATFPTTRPSQIGGTV